jgi:hypothetical protein
MHLAPLVLALLALLALAGPASGSELVARDATHVRLAVAGSGKALVTYRQGRATRHVLAWGAVDEQTTMRLDYSGGKGAWKRFADRSRRYDGPRLPWLVKAVKAPDGSYWALQAWQRKLPNNGAPPRSAIQRAWELHLSHWRGRELPKLEVWTDWVLGGKFKHLFGRYVYDGRPVFGGANTPAGVPLDRLGRNLYLDTLDSAYGPGWKRENSFLTHAPLGSFCYGFYRHGGVSGDGKRYRITAMGPGATPVVTWEGDDPGPYSATRDEELLALQRQVVGSDPRCQER